MLSESRRLWSGLVLGSFIVPPVLDQLGDVPDMPAIPAALELGITIQFSFRETHRHPTHPDRRAVEPK
jgi:hypothetical protein